MRTDSWLVEPPRAGADGLRLAGIYLTDRGCEVLDQLGNSSTLRLCPMRVDQNAKRPPLGSRPPNLLIRRLVGVVRLDLSESFAQVRHPEPF
jgi:hypothetical protein